MTVMVMEGELTSLDEAAFEAFVAERQRLGHDRHDEVWDGIYHVSPMAHGRHSHLQVELARVLGPRARNFGLRWLVDFNLGGPENYRVPDGGAVAGELAVWMETAVILVEVVSPRDAT